MSPGSLHDFNLRSINQQATTSTCIRGSKNLNPDDRSHLAGFALSKYVRSPRIMFNFGDHGGTVVVRDVQFQRVRGKVIA